MSFVSPSNMVDGSLDGLAKRVARSPSLGVVSRLDVPLRGASCRFGEATGWGLRFGIGGGAAAPGIFASEPGSAWGWGGGGAAAPLKRL